MSVHSPLLVVLVVLAALSVAGLIVLRRSKRVRRPGGEDVQTSDDAPPKSPTLAEDKGVQPPPPELGSTGAPVEPPATGTEQTKSEDFPATTSDKARGTIPAGRATEGGTLGVGAQAVATTPAAEPERPPSEPQPAGIARDPVERGGRPRGTSSEKRPDVRRSEETKSRLSRPEVVCWKTARRWHIGVEIPDECRRTGHAAVTQEKIPLAVDCEGRAEVRGFPVEVSLTLSEAEKSIAISVKSQYLLFRLIGENMSRGRLMRRAAVGEFLVVAPAEWQRDEQSSGAATIAPEQVAIDGYTGHFFSIPDGASPVIAFRDHKGSTVTVETDSVHFCLAGTQIADACDHAGPLFVGVPPRIRSLLPEGWSGITAVVVGQEGPGGSRWKTHFIPTQGSAEQEMPFEVQKRRSGWYFVRLYGTEEGPPIDCIDFRFVDGLRAISMKSGGPLPGENGHTPAQIEFQHCSNCSIAPFPPSERLLIVREDVRTVVTIPPDPAFDRTLWQVRPDGGAQAVDLALLVERVWWTIAQVNARDGHAEWTDSPVRLTRSHVCATSTHAMRVRLPRPNWIDEVRIGLACERQESRSFRVPANSNELVIPLSDFEGSKELEYPAQTCQLSLWVARGETVSMPAVIAVIPAAPLVVTTPIPRKERTAPSRRSVAEARRVRRHLARLGRKVHDTALLELVHEVRARWAPMAEARDGFRRVTTACVVALALEQTMPIRPGRHQRRKRWQRRLFAAWTADCEGMQALRTKYEAVRSIKMIVSDEDNQEDG